MRRRAAIERVTGTSAKSLPKQSVASRLQSVRFEPVFVQRVHAAAAYEGLSVSAFIREAVQERTDRVLGGASLWDRIAPLVEGVPVTGVTSDAASSTHSVFAELLAERQAGTMRSWPSAPEA